ncbi:MAG: molybdopterin-binding protein, partial [Pseudonocardiales bacterium]|nr:molybdopterin-binding protein [Pseudonocardiales bacterium]
MSTPSTPQTEKPPRSDGDGRAIPAAIATLVGLLALAAALGVGHLLAGFIAPQSSPFVAVGDGFIRITPPFLLEFAKSTFGLNDKLVLNIGMGAIIALVAVVAGLVSRRSSRPGRAIFMVLGLVGLLAALTSPVFELLGMIAPLGALVAGVGVFGWLHGLALDAAGGSAGEPRDAADRGGLSRRRLLMGTAVT